MPLPLYTIYFIIQLSNLQLCLGSGSSFRERAMNHDKRTTTSVDISIISLQQLQIEYTTFHGWIEAWLSSLSPDAASTLQIEKDIQAYDGWISTWLASATSMRSSFSITSDPAVISSMAEGPASVPQASSTATSNGLVASMPNYPNTTGIPNQQKNSPPGNNVAVYYGQSNATALITLAQLCQDKNVDIVILAFLTTFFGPGGYPIVNFGAACNYEATSAAKQKNATGLLSCPDLASDITACQAAGKKIMLSLGGSESTTAFASDTQATTFATTLWNLFGSGTSDPGLRPFGSVKVDGFDIDNEDHSTTYYSTFIQALRSVLDQDSVRPYYISAAPQCPRPDASIPLNGMQSMDFIFLQFYNNGKCNVGQSDFMDSLKAWSIDLSKGSTQAGPKLYIGAPACASCAGSGYLDPKAIQSVIKSVSEASIENIGGVVLWDGAEALLNVDGGSSYLQVVKSALSS